MQDGGARPGASPPQSMSSISQISVRPQKAIETNFAGALMLNTAPLAAWDGPSLQFVEAEAKDAVPP